MKALLRLGASQHARDARGYTAIHASIAGSWLRTLNSERNIADEVGHAVLEELLSSYDQDTSLWQGDTPLHLAAEHGLIAHVR